MSRLKEPGRYRDFDAERRERSTPPLRFRIGGEEFTVSGGLPAIAVFDLAVMSEAEGDRAFLAFRDFMLAILPNEDEGRLMGVLRSQRVPLADLAELVQWIVGEGVGRPTPRRSLSRASSRTTTRPSRVVSLSPDIRKASSA